MIFMYCGIINTLTMPTIGFSHHFFTDKPYHTSYNRNKSIEIVFVKEGILHGEFNGHAFCASEGDVLVLFRHLPITLYTDINTAHAHCSIQLLMDFDLEVCEEEHLQPYQNDGLIVPFVTEKCKETEILKKEIYNAVSLAMIERERNQLESSIICLHILQRLSELFNRCNQNNQVSIQSSLVYKIQKYISTHLHRKITLDEIAKHTNKTPNYINSVFKQGSGLSIIQYINQEKARIICDFIKNKGISFSVACEAVGIYDISYGYRLFKKHIGVTPKEFLTNE